MAVVPWYSTSFSPSRQEGLGTATLEQEHVLDGTVFVCRATAEGREDTAVTRVSVEQATTPAGERFTKLFRRWNIFDHHDRRTGNPPSFTFDFTS